MGDIRYEICEEILKLPKPEDNPKAFHLEVNIIRWNGGDRKIDIRRWADYRNRMGKGISLTEKEAEDICHALIGALKDENE